MSFKFVLSRVSKYGGNEDGWPPVHLEELESAESTERTLSGYDENVEALP